MLSPVHSSYMAHLENVETGRQSQYVMYREYYDGEHKTQLTARLRRFLQINTGDEFNSNYCPIPVDALAERLKVTGFDTGETKPKATPQIDAPAVKTQGETLWQWWQDNRMDAQQGIVHTAAARDGDAFVIVGWDNEELRPTIDFELACANGEGVKVHYSKERRGKIVSASKRWVIDRGEDAGKTRRLNLYFPNRIEKYASRDNEYEGNWQPHLDDVLRDASNVMPGALGLCGCYWWTEDGTENGKPLGVPIAHFKNKDQGADFGQSELVNVLPLQNALNKTLIDVIASADANGMPMLIGFGDKWQGVQVGPGLIAHSEKKPADASLEKIPGSDMKPLIDVKDSIAMEIARVTRTPISYFQISGQRPAEGTLQQEESGLVAKALKAQTDFGNAWEDTMKMARKVANVFGGAGLDESRRIETQWKDPQTRNEIHLLEALVLKKQLGVPDNVIWREMGYNDEEIRAFERTKFNEQQLALRNQLKVLALPPGQQNNDMMGGNNPPAQGVTSERPDGRPEERQAA